MTPDERRQMEYRALWALLANQQHRPADILGPYVTDCVRGRQKVCRDRECIATNHCKRCAIPGCNHKRFVNDKTEDR